MCIRGTCASCGKASWWGCSKHVPAVMDPIPPEERYVWLLRFRPSLASLVSRGSLFQGGFCFTWAPACNFLILLSKLLNFNFPYAQISAKSLSSECYLIQH